MLHHQQRVWIVAFLDEHPRGIEEWLSRRGDQKLVRALKPKF